MVCDEGGKHPWSWGLMCRGRLTRCEWCSQRVCEYHSANNSGGSVGGHSDCAGPRCSSSFATCTNTRPRRCAWCKEFYCEYHSQPVGSVATLIGGHNCPRYTQGYALAAVAAVGATGASRALRSVSEAGITGLPSPAFLERMAAARGEVNALRIRQDEVACGVGVLAQMAHNVYDLHEHPELLDPQRAGGDRAIVSLEGWEVSLSVQQPDFTGYPAVIAHAVYRRGDVAVLALKGTDFGSATDLALDAGACIAGSPPAVPLVELAGLVKQLQDGGSKVMVTGHSLGGYMAEVLATTCGICGVGFCAPGSGWHKGNKGGRGFQNVNFQHDVVGNVMAGIFEHAQWSVYVEDQGSTPTHDIATMLKCMAKPERSDWTNLNIASKCQSRPTGYFTHLP